MGDAAHLITPMWALGPQYRNPRCDQPAVAPGLGGAGLGKRCAARRLRARAAAGRRRRLRRDGGAAHKYMAGQAAGVKAMSGTAWANAATRTMLGVQARRRRSWRLVHGQDRSRALPHRRSHSRTHVLHGPDGRPVRLHDLIDDSFVALYFTDVRRRPDIPANSPGLKHLVVSHRDAPLDGGLRDRSLFDVGDRFRQLMGCPSDTLVLVRPDDHIAAIASMRPRCGAGPLPAVVGRADGREPTGEDDVRRYNDASVAGADRRQDPLRK